MSRLASMPPAYFALVMATGILSIACQLLAIPAVPSALLWANSLFYAVLAVLTAIRAVRFGDRFRADVMDHARSVGFFTVPAATCVLGSQWIMIGGAWRVAAALWVVGIVAWAATTYLIFTVLTVKPDKPSLAAGINGSWLVSVVAAQSVSVLGSQLAPGFGEWAPQVLFGSLAMWLGGGMLYIWIIALIFYRYTFFAMEPSDLAPPYWVNMGAVAISTLAGAMLTLGRDASPVVQDLLPFVKGLTLMFWSTATWWIPMLAILGLWRHVYRRFPLRYDPLYWGAVFPLGMYTVCTIRLSQALDVPYLMVVPQVFVWIAAAAWTAAFGGLVRSVAGKGESGLSGSGRV